MEESNQTRVCVTGGSGYIGSWLVKKLLKKGYTVHATLRNLEEKPKVELLRSLPDAETRLLLFQADIYNPAEFEPAISGCRFVFHVATPFLHNSQSFQYKDTVEAAIASVRIIADSCIRSQTVKRLIYTASVVSSSPLKEDGSGYKSSFDECCWTPLNLSYSFTHNIFLMGYLKSKTLSEKQVLSYNEVENGKLEVVSLNCGLVGGDTLLSYLPGSLATVLSIVTGDSVYCTSLRFVQEMCGTIPLLHVDDACEAHLFCMEKESLRGRFLCVAVDSSVQDMANYFQENYPQFNISQGLIGGGPDKESRSDSKKLMELGFQYKYDLKKILDDTVDCGERLGAFSSCK